jgi:hypothetical protein
VSVYVSVKIEGRYEEGKDSVTAKNSVTPEIDVNIYVTL